MLMTRKRLVIFIAVCITLVSILGCSASNSQEKLLSLGNQLLTEHKYDEALTNFLKVIEIDPLSESAYLGAADAYIGLEQKDNAIVILDKGFAALPASKNIKGRLEEIYLEQGNSYLNALQFEPAISAFQKAIDMNPLSEQAYLNSAIAFATLGQHEKAIAMFDKVIEINPLNAEAYIGSADANIVLEQKLIAVDNLMVGFEKTQNSEIKDKLSALLDALPIVERFELEKDIPAKLSLAKNLNPDTVGWLYIPDTAIDYPIVCYQDANDYNMYYINKTFMKEETSSFGISCFADCRCVFSDTISSLTNNTTIYGGTFGHRIQNVVIKNTQYDAKKIFPFDSLYLFENEEFARSHPHIYFDTLGETGVWEIIAVSYLPVNLAYTSPLLSDDQFIYYIVSEARKNSLYTYAETFEPGDKVITISTNIGYNAEDYPDGRFVVMAKLVEDSNNLKETASFENNPNAPFRPLSLDVFDPATYFETSEGIK